MSDKLSDYTKKVMKYQKTDFSTYDGMESVWAYLEVSKDTYGTYKWVKFFIIYNDEIEKEIENLEGLGENYTSDFYENIKENIIIGGNFGVSKYHPITTYLDTDLSLRTPTRENIGDWMARFSLIQNFVMEHGNNTYRLHKVTKE